ncbi:hypothetical protein M2428_000621 [Arthrobacter sp. ES3-54]|nr:hypothetical protein [Arthrobacter sp. ES3-54]
MSNVKVAARINQLLDEAGLNDAHVDKQLLFLITQHADFTNKLGAIREYNKLKARITEKVDHTVELPPVVYDIMGNLVNAQPSAGSESTNSLAGPVGAFLAVGRELGEAAVPAGFVLGFPAGFLPPWHLGRPSRWAGSRVPSAASRRRSESHRAMALSSRSAERPAGSRPSAEIQAMTSSMRARSLGEGEGTRAASAAWCAASSPGSWRRAMAKVVSDGGRRNPDEGSDALPAQSEPVHQHPFRVRRAPQPPVHNGPHPATALPEAGRPGPRPRTLLPAPAGGASVGSSAGSARLLRPWPFACRVLCRLPFMAAPPVLA